MTNGTPAATQPSGTPPAPATAPAGTVPPTTPAAPEITEDQIKSHPLYKAQEEKHAADMSAMTGRIEKMKKAVASEGEPVTPPAQTTPATTPANQQPLSEDAIVDRVRWEMQNHEKIALAGAAYTDLVAKGYNREHALIIALQDKGDQVAALQENGRQQQTAGAHTTTDRSNPASPIEGVPQAYIDSLKTGKNPLTDEQIARIVPKVLAEQKRRGAM